MQNERGHNNNTQQYKWNHVSGDCEMPVIVKLLQVNARFVWD